jgi:lipoate---protein ligase
MTYLDVTLPTLAANLALDEALLLEAEDNHHQPQAQAPGSMEVLRTWEWTAPAVVLGAAGRLTQEVHEDACRRDGVPILRRSSGGGTVLLGHGCLCFTLVLAYERAPQLTEIASSYRYILSRIAEALAARFPGIEPEGTSDLARAGRKVSGNSQQRKRRHLLHHGTLLYDFDAKRLEHYLPPPRRQPEYRRLRGHDDFLANLPIAVEELKQCLRNTWQPEEITSAWPEQTVQRLVDEKYSRVEWLRRR